MKIMKILSSHKDFFNENQTRNEQNTDQSEYNCGGYALKTFSWYTPYEFDEEKYPFHSNYDLMEYLTSDDYSIEEATEIILNSNTKKMLEDFSGKLRIVQRHDYLEADEELIAYRLSVMEDEDYVVDMDFHFIVFRNGQWMSKLGTDVVESFDFTEKPWETPYFVYNSSIVYLAHKI